MSLRENGRGKGKGRSSRGAPSARAAPAAPPAASAGEERPKRQGLQGLLEGERAVSPDGPTALLVLGASAGGVQALCEVLRRILMRPDGLSGGA